MAFGDVKRIYKKLSIHSFEQVKHSPCLLKMNTDIKTI